MTGGDQGDGIGSLPLELVPKNNLRDVMIVMCHGTRKAATLTIN